MKLSHRETQVLAWVAAGKTSKEIAALLRISQSTVDWHIANVLVKLEVSSRAEAVGAAVGDGLIPDRDGRTATAPTRARHETRTVREVGIAVLGLSVASVTVETRVVDTLPGSS